MLMKKFLLSLLCCMFAVLGMYAETYSYTFEAKQFSANGTVELNGVNWTLEGDGGYWGFDSQNGKGQQFGSSKLPYKTLTLSTSDIVGTISQIEINTAGASSVAATFAVTVGGANFGDEIKLTSAATTYTLEGSASGELVLSYAQTSSKALYIKSIKVVYTTEGGGEEPGTGGGEEPGEGEEPGTGGGEEPGTGGGEEPGEEPGDLLSVLNGDFETWVDGLPNNWKTASTAGNATLSQSTDAHSGNYSVCVAGTTSSNKRIGYKEMTLKAGTYTMKFYAKAATETGASVRPGYTPVDDANKAGTYVYGDYTNGITTSEWVEVTHEFTLEADTRLSLVIMNAKNPGGNVLIDDFTLETTDGGSTENPGEGEGGGDEPGQGEDPTPEVPSVSALWTSSFANNMGGFTLDNKVMPAELSYVWKYDSYGYMKASAYANSTRYETEAWLVSPVLSLANATDCSLVFDQAANHFTSQENFLAACKVMVKESTATDWTELAYEGFPAGNSWTFVTSTADLKTYAGKSIQLAFVYTSTSEIAGTWELKDLTIEGNGSVEVEAPEIPVPAYTTIAELKSVATATEATVKYEFTDLLVTGVCASGSNYNVYVTDGAEGLLLYGKNAPNCKAGDKISGSIESGLKLYNGLTEMTGVDYANVTVTSSDNAVTPLVLTMSEIGSNLKKYENMLVKLEGITFGAEALVSKNITMIDENDCEMTLRDNFGVLADFIFDPIKTYNVTAFVACYNGNAQLYPASAADVEVITNLLPSNVAWAKEEVAILSGEEWVVENTFSVEGDVRPTFSSSNEAVATVDESGVVTVNGYGMAEITAEVAENETYLASKATFKLFVIEGDGTLQNAYTVADVLYFYGKVTDKVWVKGTICGSLSKTNELTTDPAAIQPSNLAIGTAETFLPVQLSSKTAPRENLNLLDNPDMLGQTVWVYGNIEKYFSMPGVKSVTDFSLDGVTGIDAVETETAAKGIYLLDGRRVQQPVKGINIINGKKVVVK